MFGKNRKPSAKALNPKNEVTVMIKSADNINYHETFLMDTTEKKQFTFKGKSYTIPAQKALHYSPSFWAFGRKLAMFYELHKTLATLFDWFQFRKRANYEIGFLYEEEKSDPVNVKDHFLDTDWALDNYNLRKNQTIEGHFKAVDDKLHGPKNPMGSLMIIAAIIIVAIAAVVIVTMFTGSPHQTAHEIQNVTVTLHP